MLHGLPRRTGGGGLSHPVFALEALGPILAAYVALSTFRAVVICSGIDLRTGVPAVAAAPVATRLGLVPGAGTIIAILSAGSAWGWPWFGSTALFCGLLALWVHVALNHRLPALSSPDGE